MKGYRFLGEALEEYEDAVVYYERLRPGLGASFILDLDQSIAIALEFPEIGAPVEGTPQEMGIRRRLLQRFGVEIDYMPSDDMLVGIGYLIRVPRDPDAWDRHELAGGGEAVLRAGQAQGCQLQPAWSAQAFSSSIAHGVGVPEHPR